MNGNGTASGIRNFGIDPELYEKLELTLRIMDGKVGMFIILRWVESIFAALTVILFAVSMLSYIDIQVTFQSLSHPEKLRSVFESRAYGHIEAYMPFYTSLSVIIMAGAIAIHRYLEKNGRKLTSSLQKVLVIVRDSKGVSILRDIQESMNIDRVRGEFNKYSQPLFYGAKSISIPVLGVIVGIVFFNALLASFL